MAGHDFMDFDKATGLGGADGCTNFNHPDNNGLLECMKTGDHGQPDATLMAAYQQHCGQVSVADFFVIAAEAVMMQTRTWATNGQAQELDFKSNFKYGRTTAASCPGADGRLPNPENGCNDVAKVFEGQLQLSRRGAVALMGVHSLGRAHPQNSGYEGWWSDPINSRKFNNNYYASMLAKGWRANRSICGNVNKNMWSRSDAGKNSGEMEMMLDTDLCLAYSTGGRPILAKHDDCCAWMERPFEGPSGPLGVTQQIISNAGTFCGTPPGGNLPAFGDPAKHQCCGNSPFPLADCGSPNLGPQAIQEAYSLGAVKEFSHNEASWLTAFQEAWTQVTELGFQLTGLQADPNACQA
jgi:hypothetical protein